MNSVKSGLTCCLLFVVLSTFAQKVDTSNTLSVVEVSAPRLNQFSSGNKHETLDSALLNQYSASNLADVLLSESQIFIKSYGLGSLATSSFRGAGAGHTAVLWNGFNIQSSMNGLLDLALVPVLFLDDVNLQYGGSGALWGSSAVGGTIHLNNSSKWNQGFSLMTNSSVGSFGDQQQQLGLKVSKKRFISSVKIFYHYAKNDFEYQNSARQNHPLVKNENAELVQYGVLQENYLKINPHQKLNTRIWFQKNDRNLPPSMTEYKSAANQKDAALRITTEWVRKKGMIQNFIRGAYFKEELIYADSSVNLFSKSNINRFIAEAETQFRLSKFELINIGINSTNSTAISKNYAQSPGQNKISLFANYKVHSKHNKLHTAISIRQEIVDGKSLPFTTSFGTEYQPFSFFNVQANVAQHYRIPTFNDLYWIPGGNSNLKPESGWSEELSLVHQHSFKSLNWELKATGFNRNIENWIIWLPDKYNIWSPDNLLKVWSRGLEYKLKVNYTRDKFRIQLSALYNYVLSTNQQTEGSNPQTVGKQLIYVPTRNAQGSISLAYKNTFVRYTHVFTGTRYTLSDNSKYLMPFTIGNIHLEHLFVLNDLKVKAFVKINNCWGEVYQVMAYRAMPLMNYQLGISFYFNQPI